jgi:predicted ribosomally synthesized peptide with SipW-like signal peptide
VVSINKKVVLSLIIIFAMGLTLTLGTLAYFSDKEIIKGNILQAGTLNLEVGSDSQDVSINLQNLAPGGKGIAKSLKLKNIGTIDGSLSVTLSQITNLENECVEPEIEGNCQESESCPGQDKTCQELGGELGEYLKLAFWMDTNKDGSWTSEDYYLKSDGTKVSWKDGDGNKLPQEAYESLNNFAGKSWNNIQKISAGKETGNFKIEYFLPEDTGNIIQSDSVNFDIIFSLN